MLLICFDLDGTLLNNASEISPFTKETLRLLNKNDIAYTVATGRTMLSAQGIVAGHDFDLPQIYNNGVTVWDPKIEQLTLENLLSDTETSTIIDVAFAQEITPFVNTIDTHHNHFIFHAQTLHDVEKDLVNKYFYRTKAKLLPLQALPSNSQVTNISMIGLAQPITKMWLELNAHENLIAYSGPALEGDKYRWMDVHHRLANKGSAVTNLKNQLGASKVICFGDSDNDLSMFALADESYAPENAAADIKKAANGVIGHNHKDGIAHFLRERFSL
jgi:Cof subfamily protein (haloacid dehalogenase superfamily)